MLKKVLLLIGGGVLILVGAACAVGGGFLLIATGSDGWLSSGTHRFDTSTAALVSGADTISTNSSSYDTLGTPRLRLRGGASNGRAIFLGVAPAPLVDRYLSGAPVDEVTRISFSPYRLDKARRGGTSTPNPPASQPIWLTSVSGSGERTLDWPISDGSYRVVVMNADASPGIDMQGSVALKIPHARGIGIGALAGGIVVLLGGVALFVWGVRTGRRPFPPAARQTGAGTAAGGPHWGVPAPPETSPGKWGVPAPPETSPGQGEQSVQEPVVRRQPPTPGSQPSGDRLE